MENWNLLCNITTALNTDGIYLGIWISPITLYFLSSPISSSLGVHMIHGFVVFDTNVCSLPYDPHTYRLAGLELLIRLIYPLKYLPLHEAFTIIIWLIIKEQSTVK